jgi:hypothetical protein
MPRRAAAGRPRRDLYRAAAVGRAAALVITAVSAQRVTYRYDPTAASHGAQLR